MTPADTVVHYRATLGGGQFCEAPDSMEEVSMFWGRVTCAACLELRDEPLRDGPTPADTGETQPASLTDNDLRNAGIEIVIRLLRGVETIAAAKLTAMREERDELQIKVADLEAANRALAFKLKCAEVGFDAETNHANMLQEELDELQIKVADLEAVLEAVTLYEAVISVPNTTTEEQG